MGDIRVRLRVSVTGVSIVHELKDSPWEGVVDGQEDSDGPCDKPVRGVRGQVYWWGPGILLIVRLSGLIIELISRLIT